MKFKRVLQGIVYESDLYFKDDKVGGYCSWYCKMTWNEESLKNEADLDIFDLLFQIDTENGADISNIFLWICRFGAFEAIKVTSGRYYWLRQERLLNLKNIPKKLPAVKIQFLLRNITSTA